MHRCDADSKKIYNVKYHVTWLILLQPIKTPHLPDIVFASYPSLLSLQECHNTLESLVCSPDLKL